MHMMHLNQVYPPILPLLLLPVPHNLSLSTSWSMFSNLLSPLSGGPMAWVWDRLLEHESFCWLKSLTEILIFPAIARTQAFPLPY